MFDQPEGIATPDGRPDPTVRRVPQDDVEAHRMTRSDAVAEPAGARKSNRIDSVEGDLDDDEDDVEGHRRSAVM